MNVRSISINELIYSEAPFTEQHAIALLQVYFLGYKVATFTHKWMCVPKSQSKTKENKEKSLLLIKVLCEQTCEL